MHTLITISSSMRRLSNVFSICGLVLLVFAFNASAQDAPDSTTRSLTSSSAQIGEWDDGVSAAVRFLHELFPDINPRSRILIEDNDEWRLARGKLYTFTINICDPVFSTELKIHCSVLTAQATFLVGDGRFPSQINVETPALEKRWGELLALLHAHPKWTSAQAEDAMRASGVKYGASAEDQIILSIQHTLTKLEPFLGKLKVDSIKYYPPKPFEDLSLPPNWRVQAHSTEQDSDGSRIRYVLTFSAFDGSLESALMLGQARSLHGSAGK